MKNLIEEAYRKLDFLPIFSGNILIWIFIAVLFSLGKLDIGVLLAVTSSWILGMVFGTKFIIWYLNTSHTKNRR